MMRRKILYFLFALFLVQYVFSQPNVDRLRQTATVKMQIGPESISPYGLKVDEPSGRLVVSGYAVDSYEINIFMKDDIFKKNTDFKPSDTESYFPVGRFEFSSSHLSLLIRENNKTIAFIDDRSFFSSGISFILKHLPHYVAFFVNKDGEPHAADTTGKIYDSAQTMALLKALDPEKYRQSRERAEELGLEEQFLANKVLVWGRTYYSTPRKIKEYWKRVVYPDLGMQIQYDQQGNGYMASFYCEELGGADIWIVNPNGQYLSQIDITEYSKIFSSYTQSQIFTSSTYVGFGGNIYFYVAGEDFTEVFRIRRTWGEPDFYALAVNGYTEDSYGAYVKKVLKGLSKEELRLLRNHLFALYGYVFKDSGLKAYFDKLVWYESDTAATMDSIKLPAERKALLEMILEEEKMR